MMLIYSADSSPRIQLRSRRLASVIFGFLFALLLLVLSVSSIAGQANEGIWKTYMDAARKARQNQNYDEAEKLFKLAEAKAKEFGETDERYVSTLINLAALYIGRKKYPEAEGPYRQILTSLEKGAGKDSLDNASLVFALAQIYNNEKLLAQAEPLYKYALAISKRVLKPGDKGLINYVHLLANNYYQQEKLKEAEEAFKEELSILERDPELGKDMQTAYTLGYLALIARTLQKYDEAEKYMLRAVEVAKNQHGENHPNTASMLKALAITYQIQESRFADAVKIMQRVMQIEEAVYGKISKEVASDLVFMGGAYRSQSKYSEALPFFAQAFNILSDIPSSQPNDVDGAASSLADANARLRRYAEGEAVCKSMRALFEKRSQAGLEVDRLVQLCFENVYFMSGNYVGQTEALRSLIIIDEKLGSPKEDQLAGNLVALAGSLLKQEKYEETLAVLQRAEKIYNKKPANADFLGAMGRYYYATGKYADSESFFTKALALLEPKKDTLSEESAVIFRRRYALTLYAMGKTVQADEMFRNAIEKFRTNKRNGEAHMGTSYHELGVLFIAQGKFAEAEPLFKQAIELREKVLGSDHPDLASSLEGYAALLKKVGRATEAAPLETRAEAIRAKQRTP